METYYEVHYMKNSYGGQDGSTFYRVMRIEQFDFLSEVDDFIQENNLKEYKVYEITKREVLN